LYTDTLVTHKTLEKAFTTGVLNNGKQFDYGYGWHIDEYRSSRRIWHGGGSCGFRTEIQRYPDDKFTVFILTNRRKAELDKLAEKLTDLFLVSEE